MKSQFYAAVVSTAVALAPTLAWSYDINLGPFGHACDTCGGGVVGGLPVIGHAVNEAQAQANGAWLEHWIIASHNTAVSGAMPIPPLIRQALTGYASEDSMNRVRYKIGDNGFLNLANVIEKGGRVQAVTLIDVIIFRGPSEANDPSLWAHELTHVDQYRDWGVHSFAIQYARDYNTVEAPAYAKGDGYSTWTQNHGVQNQAPQQTASVGRFCVTNYARDMGQLEPVGSPCSNSVNPAYQFTPGAPRIMGTVAP